MKTGIPTNGSMVKNHISLKTLFGYNAIRRTSFLSVVPGLSTSPSSSSYQSTSRTPSRQESHCSTSSSSSSSSPTATSSDNETREREDQTESDTSPVPVSTNVDDRTGQPVVDQANKIPKTNKKETKIERGNPLCSDIPEWLQEFREILVDDEVPERGDSHASSSHEVCKRREDLGKHSVVLISLKTEIARSVRGPKLQGHHAEDATAEPYLVLKILVT